MIRNFTLKAIVPVAIAITGFVGICCIYLYQVIRNDLQVDAIRHETSLADTIVKATRYAMLKSDREMVAHIIDNVGLQQGVEHARIFNKKGIIMFSTRQEEVHRMVDKNGAGCFSCHGKDVPVTSLGPMEQARFFTNDRGHRVIAITAPIYNEPACYSAACHFHSSTQKLLGTIDIGFSTAPLDAALKVLKVRMALFSFMILLLTVAGVTALLRRNVLLPIRQLVEMVHNLARGNDIKPPATGDEIQEVGETIARLANQAKQK